MNWKEKPRKKNEQLHKKNLRYFQLVSLYTLPDCFSMLDTKIIQTSPQKCCHKFDRYRQFALPHLHSQILGDTMKPDRKERGHPWMAKNLTKTH